MEENKKHHKHHNKENCHCENDNLNTCQQSCNCENKDCNCDKQCECQNCEENCESAEEIAYQTGLEEKVLEYVRTAQRIQADFDNYRKRAEEKIAEARFDGKADAVKEFIPALDSFKNAKSMITDEKILEGFNMIENQILSAFKTIGVEKIEAKGLHFDPHFHNALAVMTNNELDNDVIIDEYQAGYKIKDKIIRYSQVIVNKKEE